MLECVVNVSEGRDRRVLDALADAVGDHLLDVNSDPHHHRSVLTIAGPGVEDAVRRLARVTVGSIDLRSHAGAHPRIGALDVVPFVPLDETMEDAVAARDRFARWAGEELELPCFLYGPERSLPHVRREAFKALAPDTGPREPHLTAGACAVGARAVLVAYNVWLTEPDVGVARRVAAAVRSDSVRALGLDVGGRAQVSMNLVDPLSFGPADAYDAVASRCGVARAELVGLVPAAVLAAIDASRWPVLDLDPSRTIEARLGARGAGR